MNTRTPLVAGNWKMHGSRAETATLLKNILNGLSDDMNCDVAVFPPSIYIPQVSEILQESRVLFGGQNLSSEPKGAYTGEISAAMLTDFGCHSVLVGHSERRQLFGESSDIVAQKYMAAAQAGLMPVLCVGETLAQRESGETLSVVSAQINAVISLENGLKALYNGVIAYEPVWAIGTGKTASPEQAQEVHAAIRSQIAGVDKPLAEQLRILYGGSVNRNNAAALFAMPDIDGGLIGGASLDAEHFLDIVRLCNNY